MKYKLYIVGKCCIYFYEKYEHNTHVLSKTARNGKDCQFSSINSEKQLSNLNPVDNRSFLSRVIEENGFN